jgi:exodeoxyribonuclease-1
MSYVFYDTETTGLNPAFDQILQFAAIRTDSDLNEIDRFEIRSRLLPYVVPSPVALKVTGVSVAQLTDPNLPSYYEMTRAVRAKLLEWSPAIFIGHNSIAFDEKFLRQALYQSLHDPYLTNSNQNQRSDSLRIIQATHLYADGIFSYPTGANGQPSFKLDQLAPANGFAHKNAHDAMADVEATIYLCHLAMERAPHIWSSFMRFAQKAAVRDHVFDELIFSYSDFIYGRPYSWIVTAFGTHPERPNEIFLFDLDHDPDELAALTNEGLAEHLNFLPRPVKKMRCNASPVIFDADDAPHIAAAKSLSRDVLEARAARIRDDARLIERLTSAMIASETEYPKSPFVEEQIYDGFYGAADKGRMEEFHSAPWEGRPQILGAFEDPRVKCLAQRILFTERPDLLSAARVAEIKSGIARRVLDNPENGPWLTISQALEETIAALAKMGGDETKPLLEFVDYLEFRRAQLLDDMIS